MLNNPKRNIVILLIAGFATLIAYGITMATAFQQINEASITLDKPEPVRLVQPAAKQADVTPQAAPATETVNVPVAPKPAATRPQTTPHEAVQATQTEETIPTPAKPKCDQAYIDTWQAQIDERNDLIEAKQLKDYETDFVMRTQILENGLAEYKKGCE